MVICELVKRKKFLKIFPLLSIHRW